MATPVQQLAHWIDQIKDLPFLSFFALNRKKGSYAKGRYPKDVSFDYMAIFNLRGGVHRNDLGDLRANKSFSLAFDFIDCEPCVRATVKLGQEEGVEYSRSFSVEETRDRLKLLFERELTKDTVQQAFIDVFEIKTSKDYSMAELRQLKNDFVKKIDGLREELANCSGILGLRMATKREELSRELLFFCGEYLKEAPGVIRKYLINELRYRNLRA